MGRRGEDDTNKMRRRKVTSSNSNSSNSSSSSNNTYRRVSSKPKKHRKSNKGKIIGGFLGAIVLIGVIGFALVKFDFIDLDILDGIFNKGDDLSKEVYCKEVSEENIKYNDGILYADNQVSLIANEGVKKREIKKLAKQYGAEIVGYIEFTGDYQLEFSEEKSYDELNSIVSELESDSNVESASLYRVTQMTSSGGEISDDTNVSHRDGELNYDGGTESFYPNDPWGKSDWDKMNPDGKNWGAEAIHATEAWALKDEMDYVRMGLLDTNVDEEHEDLKSIFKKVWKSSESSQDAEHGTHVAGIMGAQFGNEKGISGICPKSTLYASDIYGYNYISEMGLKCGFARLILNDVKVINCSFGEDDFCIASSLVNQNIIVNQEARETIQEDLDYYKETYTIFLNKFIDEGYDFLIVKSAGNENGYYYRMVEKSDENPYGIEVYDPEKHSDISEFTKCENIDAKNDVFSNITDEKLKSRIIVVGADVQYEDGYALSYFSNIGGRVDVLAPGENIYSTVPNNEYDSLGGTSMSAPHVSGLAGMIWGINNDLAASQVKQIIVKTANIDVANTDKNMINARMAVELAKKIKSEGKDSLSEKGAFLCSVADANKYETSDKSDAEKEQEAGTNALLESVKVTLKDKAGNEIETLDSNGLGEVSILVDSGTYDIVFEKEGYESSILKDVEIKSNDVVYKKVLMKKEKDITMEQFKNSYLYICTDNCKIKDVYSCPYVGDSNNAKYTKLSNDEFEIKYDKLAFVFKCDGKKSYMIKYINKSNPEGYQVYTDEESLNEVSAQAHDWYNSYKKELVEKENKNNGYDNNQNNEENGSISKNKALKLAQSKGGTYDEELGTNILYTNEGICYHEDCFCTYKDKPSYLFTVKLENTNRVIGYICVYNDGSLVEWYNPNDNW